MLFKGTDMKILPIAIVCLLKSTNSVAYGSRSKILTTFFSPLTYFKEKRGDQHKYSSKKTNAQ